MENNKKYDIDDKALMKFSLKIGIIITSKDELLYELSDRLNDMLDYVGENNYEEAFKKIDSELDGLLTEYHMTYHFPKGKGYYAKIRQI